MTIRRLVLPLVVAALLQLPSLGTASAQPAPQFRLGFATLASLIPNVVGSPVENEHYGLTGDSLQRTTNGLMVWRKADNWTAFTDGYRTWVNGPQGLQVRLNAERFGWERSPGQVSGAPPPAPPAAIDAGNSSIVQAWSPLLEDQKLRDSLVMAYGVAPDWRQFADVAAERETRVQWAAMSPVVGGITSNGYSRGVLRVGIRLNSELQHESTQVVAAVLAHETYHAATAENADSGEACLQDEINAYKWQAYVWQLLPRPAVSTPIVQDQDQVTKLVNSGRIDSYIRNAPAYQRECDVR